VTRITEGRLKISGTSARCCTKLWLGLRSRSDDQALKMTRESSIVLLVTLLTASLPGQKRATEQFQLPSASPTSGPQMFRAYCADCHGVDGKGNGPVAAVLKISPPDLTTLTQRNQGTFPYDRVFKTISGDAKVVSHGTREMPVWGPVFREMGRGRRGEAQLRLKTLTNYISSLQVLTK
jgi:mono/diheme cytochrome c family protein